MAVETSADTCTTGPVCDVEYPLIDEGTYDLQCVSAHVYRHPGLPDRPWKAQLEFRDGFDEHPSVFAFFHLGCGRKPHAGRMSRYWHAWCIANAGPPRKRQTMSARAFKGRWFQVKVETVREKRKGELLPSHLHYSVVREIRALHQ